jgi:hypothetical protein
MKEADIVSVLPSVDTENRDQVTIQASKADLDFDVVIAYHDDHFVVYSSYDGYALSRHHFFSDEDTDRQDLLELVNTTMSMLTDIRHRQENQS